jgi:hypothetical protein
LYDNANNELSCIPLVAKVSSAGDLSSTQFIAS